MYFEINKMKIQIIWDVAKVVFIGKLVALTVCIRKEER